MSDHYFIGVDVGTGSARAALVSGQGNIIDVSVKSISVFNPKPDFYEQSSIEIWDAVCTTVKNVSEKVDKNCIKGIGFDATCSLVVLDSNFSPLSISPDQGNECNDVILWMDHRAKEEAKLINSKCYEFQKYVGGKVSVEMQMPKLLWLKRHLQKCWKSARHFFDLPDYLTFKATGSPSRSLCSLICKWTYLSDGVKKDWDRDFLSDIGLIHDLLEEGSQKIEGNQILAPGDYVGGLSKEAALELGLIPDTPVAASLIDAHAGGLALMAAGIKEVKDLTGRLGLICGTSTCHMCLNKDPIFTPGIWGPYLGVIAPNFWASEGGQSATGSLVDFIILNHPASKECPKDMNVYQWLEGVLGEIRESSGLSHVSFLTKDLHFYPDYHGNRSPLADPHFKGMICGASLDTGVKNLALNYLSILQSLAYGTKDIIEALCTTGHEIKCVLMCGGLAQSHLYIQTHADVLGMPVLIPETKESVLLGAAMLGAAAACKQDLAYTAIQMGGSATAFKPSTETYEFHIRKFEVFKQMQKDQKKYTKIMNKD